MLLDYFPNGVGRLCLSQPAQQPRSDVPLTDEIVRGGLNFHF